MNALGYIRISPRGANYNGVSLDVQAKAIKDYCQYKNIELVGIYGDKFISGKSLADRPGANAMLMIAQEKKIDAVIIYKLDRFMRNTIETLDCCALLEEWGIKFISLHEEINTGSATGRFFLTVIAALGQMEREQVSERTKAALAHKKSIGEKYTGVTPFGLKTGPGKKLQPNIDDYNCYLRLKQLYVEKVPYTLLEDQLYAEGFRNRRGGKRKYSDLWRLRKRFDENNVEDLWAEIFGENAPTLETVYNLPCE